MAKIEREMVELLKDVVAQSVAGALKQLGVDDFQVKPLLENPPSPDLGDFAFPCFQLARLLRRAPAQIASELANILDEDDRFGKVEAVQAYVNIFLDRGTTVVNVVEDILQSGADYGNSSEGNGRVVVIDYSSPNIAKPFHIGHLRSTIIGHALHKIFSKIGYETVRINHLGDWGTQFGKLIVAYNKWGDEEALNEDPIKELHRLYVLFHDEAEKQPSLDDEARAAFKALEDGDPDHMSLWARFRQLSLDEFDKIYSRLGVTFDSDKGESAYVDSMDSVVSRLEGKGLLVESENASVVELDDMPPCLIKKADGATLYATRDLAAAYDRYENYRFAHLFYVVGMPQQLHFKQVFAVLHKLGEEWADRLEHIGFGHIRIGSTQLSTRRGHVLLLEDLLNEAVQRVQNIISERNPDLENADEIAEMVGIGAVIFNDLSHNRIKDISFNMETALNFEGDTGPYVQYTHARAASLLRRGDFSGDDAVKLDPEAFTDDESFHLAMSLALFPSIVRDAALAREPSIIARYLLGLCQRFNGFYHARKIIGEPFERDRLAVVKATKDVIKNGLDLLGIQAPDAM